MARLTESEYKAEIKRLKARVNKLVREHKLTMGYCSIVDGPNGGYIVEKDSKSPGEHDDLAHAVGRRVFLLKDEIAQLQKERTDTELRRNADPHGLVAEQAQVFDRMRTRLHVLGFRQADVEEAFGELCDTFKLNEERRTAEHAELDQAAINGVVGIDISTLPAHVVERLNVLAKSAAMYKKAYETLRSCTLVMDTAGGVVGITLPAEQPGECIKITVKDPDHCCPPDRDWQRINGEFQLRGNGRLTPRQNEIADLCLSLCVTLFRKNQDYSNSSSRSPLFAPELSPDAAVRVRMSDKAERIISLSSPENSGPAVKNESLQDTYLDLAGYCILQTINLNAAAPKQS